MKSKLPVPGIILKRTMMEIIVKRTAILSGIPEWKVWGIWLLIKGQRMLAAVKRTAPREEANEE